MNAPRILLLSIMIALPATAAASDTPGGMMVGDHAIGVYGAYLPVLHALGDRLTYVHVQHYNAGSIFGRDGTIYYPETADFHAAKADALLAGFTVDAASAGIEFEPFPAEKVLIGLPASPLAAGSGFTPVQVVQQSLGYLILGREYGGQYTIGPPFLCPIERDELAG